MNSTLLQQVRLLNPITNRDEIVDVLIIDGEIRDIKPKIDNIPEDTIQENCQGLILAPGLVDLYSHSGQPGYEERETLTTLSAAATAGGFTRVSILPNTLPPIDNAAGLMLLQQKVQAINSSFPCRLSFWGGLTLDIEGKQMTELAELAETGVIGFTDGKPLTDLLLVRRLLEYLKPLGKPIAFMAVNSQLAGNGVMREGVLSVTSGLPASPDIAESAALAALLEIVAAIGTPVHLMRISTARSVELIANAKAQGLPITASTTWMHLLCNTQHLGNYDPNLRLQPPLGNKVDQLALIDGVKSGVIDAIAVDHTPYTYEEKTVAFAQAPPGVIGLELALPLLWQALVTTGKLSALELWSSLSTTPQKCLRQQPITCDVGGKAEFVLFDPQSVWEIKPKTLQSASCNTPWLGKEITGRVVRVWN